MNDLLHHVILTAGLVVLLLGCAQSPGRAEVSPNLLKNPSFEEGADANGVPAGWSLYAGGGKNQRLRFVRPAESGQRALLIEDNDPTAEIGIVQSAPAQPGLTYGSHARVKAIRGASPYGAYMQLRFLPSQQFVQVNLVSDRADRFKTVSARATAPEGTTAAVLYLYTHREPTPQIVVDSVCLVSGEAAPPGAPPEPVPPVYSRLKDLHLHTDLARDGKAAITLVIPASGLYRREAERIREAVLKIAGVRIPIALDDSPAGAVPIRGSLILLGNRSTHRTISELYDRYYTLLDLKYPGPGGYEARTLHDPFGNGKNVIFAGGSDAAGVRLAAGVLIRRLKEVQGRPGTLSIGWLMEIRPGKGVAVPKDLKDFETWEASAGYGSSGYFGWNSISKRMAMYYMTGDPFQAREALRLAFPDEQAKREIVQIDGERIENKDDPLAGPYHYNAHLMILFWDLIEESPVFTDEERLKVINAFARQLAHRRDEGVYTLTEPLPRVDSRHHQWSAISLYCLGRYFQKSYPDPVWRQCVRGAEFSFASLREHAWVFGENDNHFWYCTGTVPILTYLLLSGDRKPVRNGVLQTLLRGQEILISGRQPDWALNYAALDYLHKAAYLTGDGRWLAYRDRTGLNLGVFRLGQSFWPDKTLKPRPPEDLANRWSVYGLTGPLWQSRGSGLPLSQSFQFASFRSRTDAGGDCVLLDGFNGAGRNPYHTFALLELRLGGHTLLQGYRNQLMTKADGLVEPQVAMDAALRSHVVLGETVLAVGEVPKAAYGGWKRTLVQRKGRYALVVDEFKSRADSANLEAQILWERPYGWEARPQGGILRSEEAQSAALPQGWKAFRALEQPLAASQTGPESLLRLDSLGIALLKPAGPGGWLEMAFRLPKAATGEWFADLLNYRDRGAVRFFLDGKPVGPEFDHYAETATARPVSLGTRRLAAGAHTLRVQAVQKNPASGQCFIGLAGLSFRPEGAPGIRAAQSVRVCCSLPLTARVQGSFAIMRWEGPVKKGERKIFFSLVGLEPEGRSLFCSGLAENAAALLLPEPALAVAGRYQNIEGEAVVLSQDHLFGKGLRRAEPLHLAADHPVDADWDLISGVLNVSASRKTGLSLPPLQSLTLDGQPVKQSPIVLEPGRHILRGARLRPAILQENARQLAAHLAAARAGRAQSSAEGQAARPQAPPLEEAFSARIGGGAAASAQVPTPEGPMMAVAAGSAVHLLDGIGREARTFRTDGAIRKLHWWPEYELLIAGCADEKVIAFDREGNRIWEFVSEMDPAVFRAAKDYWFKTAPGHEGIHGLYSGVFLEGKSQLFVGSACTLELLDGQGRLVRRLPVFWGTGAVFQIINGPEGSLNLLQGRSLTDGPWLAVINNRTLDPNPRGFSSVPPGHTYVGGWGDMNRAHLFYEDIDGDGQKEVVSEINGVWNRVTVWNEQGDALYNAQFGPGESVTAGPIARNMRALDIADLDGDGKKEILAATSGGLVVALDHRCRKLWSYRLPAPLVVMKAVASKGKLPFIIVGCEDGSVAALDGKGNLVRSAAVTGSPVCIEILPGPVAALATDQGTAQGFRME
ncbi:MAG: VCBS repeat-containing protein [Armatimonadetes bacterium]|nr:VCBS repeat-containing protein [Armatimonadota bacterium]